MGMIVQQINIMGDKGKTEARVLFDSGASDSVIRKDVAQKIATSLRLTEPVYFILGDGKTAVKSEYFTGVSFVLKDCVFPAQRVLIVDELEEDLILGVDAFQRWKLKLDFEKEEVLFDKDTLKLRLV